MLRSPEKYSSSCLAVVFRIGWSGLRWGRPLTPVPLRDDFGQMLQFYDGIAIGVSDYISDAQTVGTSTDCSVIYAFRESGSDFRTAAGAEAARVKQEVWAVSGW